MKFNGSCNSHHKCGHKNKECWLNEDNASERPHNWKSGARTLEKNSLNADEPPEITLAIADNEDSSLATDTEDNFYETDLDSEWKLYEYYFRKSNDNYGNANEIKSWLTEDYGMPMLIQRDIMENNDSVPILFQRHIMEHDELIEEDKSDGSFSTCSFESGKTLANMSMPTDFKLLSTPNTWIADTGATIHNVPVL